MPSNFLSLYPLEKSLQDFSISKEKADGERYSMSTVVASEHLNGGDGRGMLLWLFRSLPDSTF
jgi:hypothetical protein